jgi:chromate transport protein ChrA
MPARNKLTRPAPRLGDIFPAPRLGDIFIVFLRMGATSFGGGMTSWTRREVVERRGWIDDRQFLSGVAMSQISPGANGVNIAVFVGTVAMTELHPMIVLASGAAVLLAVGG